jgi:sugar phosphate isomerase/epimerase
MVSVALLAGRRRPCDSEATRLAYCKRIEERWLMRIGFDHYTIAHRALGPESTLDLALERGFDGVQFLEPGEIEPSLDHVRLAAFSARARGLGLYAEVGLPSPNPARASRTLGRQVTSEEHARALERHVEAIAALGCRHARAYVGDRHDRFRSDPPWNIQRALTLEVLERLDPCLRANRVRIAIETHADLTVDELLDVLARLGPERAGVTLDTGNLPMRLEDPVEAAERLAPWVLSTHVKDAVLAFTPRGLCWQARPVGSGTLPIPEMIAAIARTNPDLNLSIELHPRTYDLPIYDPTWLAYFPGLRPTSLAAVVRLAAHAEQEFARGALPRPESIEAIPWSERDLEWLDRSRLYLKGVVAAIEARGP